MSKTPNEQLLFELISSLTKSEKRSFKLFAKRSGATSDAKFIRLFDAMERLGVYNESAIRKRLPEVTDTQFANLKSHLYGQVLASLRQSSLKYDIDIELREQLDYIRVLYKKGLYQQSLRLLKRAKNITGDYRKDLFQLSLLDYEKQIRSQQVFDLREEYVNDLEAETDRTLQRFSNVQQFFTLATRMKAQFIENGTVKNEVEMNNLRALFYTSLPKYEEDKLAFNEKFYLYRAYYWFSYLTYDFGACVVYAEKWVNIFKETGLDKKRIGGFLKGLNRLLQSAFRVNDSAKFEKHFQTLLDYEGSKIIGLEGNTLALFTKYKALQTLNNVFLNASFSSSKQSIYDVLKEVESQVPFIDQHNLMIIYYKAGVYYYALSEFSNSRFYLNKLIFNNDHLRSDLKSFARIISILIDYDTGEEEQMENKIKLALTCIQHEDNMAGFQKSFLEFMSKLGFILPHDLKSAFQKLRSQLESLQNDRLQAKPLLYFDLFSWIDSKIEGKPFAEMVRKKVNKP